MNDLLQKICNIAEEAGRQMTAAEQERRQAGSLGAALTKTGHANFVTKYDQMIQRQLVQALGELIPDAHFVGEENGQDTFTEESAKGWTFVIDPIDGTSNFMKGYFPSVISIGLFYDGKPEIGVVYCPASGQLFSAQRGQGAYENGTRIHVSDESLSNCLVSLGTAPYYEDCREDAQQAWRHYLDHSIDIRRSGSAAYDLCMVASGRTGLFYEPRLCLWDYAAGACIVEEAGGMMTDGDAKALTYRGKSGVIARGSGIAEKDLWQRG